MEIKDKTTALLQRLVSFAMDIAELSDSRVTVSMTLTVEPVCSVEPVDEDEGDS